MAHTDGRVWYASYGSNANWDRFRTYLEGGAAPGAGAGQRGARDPSPPEADLAVSLPFTVYFARSSRRWGGAVAFADHHRHEHHVGLARAWLVTVEQFEDIAAQESGREAMRCDLDALRRDGHLRCGDGWYDHLLHVGDHDGMPIVTFTATEPLAEQPTGAPSAPYLRHVGAGLADAHGLDDDELGRYLLGCPGVTDGWDEATLAALWHS
ncbi:MAG: histone deacetylase [Actinomycetota bacterium]|nr:histone deacetylase [Actinomycetota bacterium]